jgi:hypothetical protein
MFDTRENLWIVQHGKKALKDFGDCYVLVTKGGCKKKNAILYLYDDEYKKLISHIGSARIEVVYVKRDGDFMLVLRRNDRSRERAVYGVNRREMSFGITLFLDDFMDAYGNDVRRVEAVPVMETDEEGNPIVVVMFGDRLE